MDQPSPWQRLIIGVLAAVLLIVGVSLYFAGPGNASGATGIMIRLGVVLGAIWLAMPQLNSMRTRLSTVATLVVLALLVVAAGRPNYFRIAAGLVSIGLALNWALNWLGKFSGPPRR